MKRASEKSAHGEPRKVESLKVSRAETNPLLLRLRNSKCHGCVKCSAVCSFFFLYRLVSANCIYYCIYYLPSVIAAFRLNVEVISNGNQRGGRRGLKREFAQVRARSPSSWSWTVPRQSIDFAVCISIVPTSGGSPNKRRSECTADTSAILHNATVITAEQRASSTGEIACTYAQLSGTSRSSAHSPRGRFSPPSDGGRNLVGNDPKRKGKNGGVDASVRIRCTWRARR